MANDSTDTPPDGGTDATPVIRMADFGVKQPERIVAGLRAYWDTLRGNGRAVPMRTDVQPHGIRDALDYAFILERIAPGAARFRLAGRHLVDLMGMEVRGMPLCSILNAPSRGRLSDVLETVFKGPQIAELILTSTAGYGRPELQGRLLLLPLRSDLGDVTRALGCLISAGEVGRGPRRFDIVSDRVEAVIAGARVLDPRPSDHELAEPPAPWRPQFSPDLAPLLDRPAPATASPKSGARASGSSRPTPNADACADQTAWRSAAGVPVRRERSSSATRNASSSDWLAFRRGSHAV